MCLIIHSCFRKASVSFAQNESRQKNERKPFTSSQPLLQLEAETCYFFATFVSFHFEAICLNGTTTHSKWLQLLLNVEYIFYDDVDVETSFIVSRRCKMKDKFYISLHTYHTRRRKWWRWGKTFPQEFSNSFHPFSTHPLSPSPRKLSHPTLKTYNIYVQYCVKCI